MLLLSLCYDVDSISTSISTIALIMCWHVQVVDETDRMLRQSYQDWLPYLTTALAAQQRPLHQRVVKVVVSATLTRDPSKVERLGLHCPRYIAMTSQDHRSVSASLSLSCFCQRLAPLMMLNSM